MNLSYAQNGEPNMKSILPIICNLNNGMTLIIENRPGSGVFAMCLSAPDRCIYEQPGKNGTGELLANLMSDGCRGLSRGEFFSLLNSMGAVLRTSQRRGGNEDNYFNNEQSIIRLETLNRFAEKAVDLLRDIVAVPNLNEDDISVRRGQLMTLLKEEEKKPLYHARRIFYEKLTGGHPYSRNPLGEKDSLPGISADDLQAFRDTLFHPSNLVLAVATSLPADEVAAMVEKSVEKSVKISVAPLSRAEYKSPTNLPLKESVKKSVRESVKKSVKKTVEKSVAPLSRAENKSPANLPPEAGAARLPDNTGTAHSLVGSHFAIGTAHSPVGSPTFFPFSPCRYEDPQNLETSAIMAGFPVSVPPEEEAAMHIAMSLLSSHLSYRLRECQGFAYAVITSLEKTRYGSFVKVSMETLQENAMRAAQSLREEFSAFHKEYITADDIRRIKGSYRGRTLMNRLSSINRAYYLTGNYILGEPLNYYAVLLKRMEALTGHQVMEVMRKHLWVGEMVEVVC